MNESVLFETPEPLTDAENVGPLYVDYRTQAADDALIDQARRRAQALTASQPGGETGPQEAVPDGAAMTQAETMDAGGLERFGQSVVAGGKDLANFVIRSPIEVPRAVWYGLQKSAAALLSLPLEAGAAIDQLELEHGLISEETVRKHRRWIEAIKTAPDADTILNVKPPETVTGNVVASAVQFISVAGRAAQLIKAAGIQSATAVNAGAGFVSATTAFQGSEDSLAEWIQSNPKYANFVTEFLASDPDDSEAEKRLKNGLEGALGGLVLDSFLAGLKMLKAGRAAGMSAPQQGAAPLPPKSESVELTPGYLQQLGDPNAPLVHVADNAAAQGTAEGSLVKPVASAADNAKPPTTQVFDTGPFADGQLRHHADMKAYVQAEVMPKAKGEFVINPTFELDGLAPQAYANLRKISELFGTVPNRLFISGRSLKHIAEGRRWEMADIDDTLNSVLRSPDFVLPNPTAPDPLRRPWLLKQFADGKAVLVEVRTNGKGIDVVNVISPVDASRLTLAEKKAAELGLTLDDLKSAGPEGRTLPSSFLASPMDDASRGLRFSDGRPDTRNIGNLRTDINWYRVETGDDIQSVLRDLTDAFPDDVPPAQRGVASKEATQAAADALGMSVDDVLKQRNGVDFTAEQVQAASRLLTASQEKLIEVARAAAEDGATAVEQYAFRRMLATQYAIQAEVLGAGGKTASALDTWLLPAGSGQEQMRALEQRLLASGGEEVSKALAWRLSALAQAGVDPKVMNQAIRRAASANTVDAVRQIYVDGLLSTPLPHVANTAGGLFVAMQQIVERGVAGKIARATGSGGVAEGEATAMMYGLLSGQWDALRLASRTLLGKAAKPSNLQLGKLEGPRFDLDQTGGPGRVVDYLGKAFGIGPKLLDSTDAYFKTIGYRMELHAQAFRQARSEGLEGAAFKERVAALVADPPANIRLAAADAALYNTFSNPNGAFGQALLKMRNGGGALNPLPFVLPFVRTPVNVARYTFERTPLAPLVGQWRADIAAGGARRDLALARMAVGSTALAVATDLAMQGKVSGEGPKDPAERDQLIKTGWRRNAVNIGGTWHAYNPSDPLGQTLAFAADLTDALNSGDVDPDHVAQWDEVTAGGIAALAQFATDKRYLQGLADFAQVMTDPERYGDDYLGGLGGAFLSAGAAEAKATPLAAMQARIASLTAELTPRRDLWGNTDGTGDGSGAIDQELLRLGTYPPSIQKKTSFQNVPVNFRDWPEVYDEYVRLAGNALKSPLYDGLGAKDLLDQVVTGSNRWSEIYAKGTDGPEGTKARFVQSIVRQFRTAAQNQIMNDPRFKDFAAYVRRMQAQSAMPLEKTP